MGYYEQHLLSQDADFIARCAACLAVKDRERDPTLWADSFRYRLAAAPGFADQYTYAISTGVENPGRDPAVITDEQILAAVSALLGTDAP